MKSALAGLLFLLPVVSRNWLRPKFEVIFNQKKFWGCEPLIIISSVPDLSLEVLHKVLEDI